MKKGMKYSIKIFTIIVLGLCLAFPAVTSMLVRADDTLTEINVLKIPDGEIRKQMLSLIRNRVDPVIGANPTAKLAPGEVQYDTDNLYSSDITALSNVSYFGINGKAVTDLTGLVEYLPNLTNLTITNISRGFDTIDISGLKKLGSAQLNNVNVKNVIIGDKPLLTELQLDSNDLTNLDLSRCTKLKKLYISNNSNLNSLDFSYINSLEFLDAAKCGIKKIEFGSQPALKDVYLNNNALTEIDTSGCPKLEVLRLNDNQLTSLDFTNNKKLYQLSFANNQVLNFYIPKLEGRPYPEPPQTYMAASSIQYLTGTYWYWQNPRDRNFELDLTQVFTHDQISRITSLVGTQTGNGGLGPNNDMPDSENYYKKTGKVIFDSNLLVNEYIDVRIGGVSDQYEPDCLVIKIKPIVGITTRFASINSEQGSVDKDSLWFKQTDIDKSFTVTATAKTGYKFKQWLDKDLNIIQGTQGNPILNGIATTNYDVYIASFYADKNDNNVPDDEEGSLVIKNKAGAILSTFWLPISQNVIMNDYQGAEIEHFTMSNNEISKSYPNLDQKVLTEVTGALNSDDKFIVKPIYKDDRNDNGFADDTETHYTLALIDNDFGVLSATPDKNLLIGDQVKLTVTKKKNYVLKTILVNGHDLGVVDKFVVNNTILPGTRATTETIIVEAVFEEDMNNNGLADSEESKYSITLDKIGEGDVNADATQSLEGIVVTLSAQAKEDYEFKGWKSDDVVITDGKFTMPKKAVKVTAVFEKKKTEDKPGGDVVNPGSNTSGDNGNVVPAPGSGSSSGTITIKPNPDGKKPTPNPDGTITIPNDSTVILPGGTEVTLPNGGEMQPNGSVELPVGGSVVYPNGKVVTVVDGGTLYANGTITDKLGNVLMILPKTGVNTTADLYIGLAIISILSAGFILYKNKFRI